MTQSDPTKTPRDAADVAWSLAEAVRELNYATTPGSSLEYPADAYTAVGGLDTVARRLPQAYRQLREFLEYGMDTDRVTADYGSASDHLSAADEALRKAAEATMRMAQALSRAHSALAPLGYQ